MIESDSSRSLHMPSVTETRNSQLRIMTRELIQENVDRIHDMFPDLTATHLNLLGALGVSSASALAAIRKGDGSRTDRIITAASMGLISVATSLDALDGTLARTIASERPYAVNFNRGQLYDVLGDRFGEVVMAISRAVYAHHRKDTLGANIALLNASLTTLPSVARAFSESAGHPVPETGRGPLGLFGTRAGRAVFGIAATMFPEIKGVPLQRISDALVIAASLTTTLDRLRVSRSTVSENLSQSTRDQAKTRAKALTIFAGVSLGAALFTYLRLNKNPYSSVNPAEPTPPEDRTEKEWYLHVLTAIENYCRDHHLKHRFVGGTLTDLLSPSTSYEVDAGHRSVQLNNHLAPSLFRSDGSLKDVDLVIFSKDQDAFKEAKKTFKRWSQNARKFHNTPFPNISIEAARYPDWPARKKIKQFVSAFEIDHSGNLNLVFGSTSQRISWDSIEPWHVILEDGTKLTTFNPLGHALCYMLRIPSGVKPKDKVIQSFNGRRYSKISLMMKLAHEAIETGKEIGIDYREMYREWTGYIQQLRKNPDVPTKLKAAITKWFWSTIGTDVSHGVGLLGRLSSLSNRFNG